MTLQHSPSSSVLFKCLFSVCTRAQVSQQHAERLCHQGRASGSATGPTPCAQLAGASERLCRAGPSSSSPCACTYLAQPLKIQRAARANAANGRTVALRVYEGEHAAARVKGSSSSSSSSSASRVSFRRSLSLFYLYVGG